jgi:hypothetical protein
MNWPPDLENSGLVRMVRLQLLPLFMILLFFGSNTIFFCVESSIHSLFGSCVQIFLNSLFDLLGLVQVRSVCMFKVLPFGSLQKKNSYTFWDLQLEWHSILWAHGGVGINYSVVFFLCFGKYFWIWLSFYPICAGMIFLSFKSPYFLLQLVWSDFPSKQGDSKCWFSFIQGWCRTKVGRPRVCKWGQMDCAM